MGVIWDVAVAGGGPAGLAFAAHAARQGLRVVVFDRQKLPADKPCGEGLMPAGLRALENLGARADIASNACAPFRGIRYVQEDGAAIEGRLPDGGGLGIRRTALSAALVDCAARAGAILRDGAAIRNHLRDADGVTLSTDRESLRARVLVAADGLHSPLRRAEGLEGPLVPLKRFGLRRHFATAPWNDCVEVHFSAGAEAYVTPCGPDRVGVAFLWEPAQLAPRASFDSLVARFPVLAEHLRGAEATSRPQGAGPLWQTVRGHARDRFVLLGDAAGYVDALTGEGLSLALQCAETLARTMPEALTQDGRASGFAPYVTQARTHFARYQRLTRAMLALARRPRLRRAAFATLRKAPSALDRILALALG